MDKKAHVYLDVSSQSKKVVPPLATFGSQDVGTATIQFHLIDDGLPCSIPESYVGIIVLSSDKGIKFTDNVEIINHKAGIVEYTLSSTQLSNIGVMQSELFISGSGVQLSCGKFSIEIEESLDFLNSLIGNGVPDISFTIDKNGHLIMEYGNNDTLEFEVKSDGHLEVKTWQ